MRFFNFMNFFAIFFGIFLPGSSKNGIRDKNYFLSFSTYLIPFWLEIISKVCFLILWYFLQFSCPGRVWPKFGTKIFFSLSQPITSPFWLKIMPGRGFLIFSFFFLFFLEFSFSDRVWTEFGTKIFFFSFLAYLISFWVKKKCRKEIL